MNAQVLISIAMGLTWLVGGIIAIIVIPQLREPFGDDPRITMGWALVLLLILWNAVRAYLSWKPAPREDQFDDFDYR